MTKLKCWKKVGGSSRIFKHFVRGKESKHESLFVHRQDYDSTAYGYKKKSEWFVSRAKYGREDTDKKMPSEKSANNFAKKYMKEHDKC